MHQERLNLKKTNQKQAKLAKRTSRSAENLHTEARKEAAPEKQFTKQLYLEDTGLKRKMTHRGHIRKPSRAAQDEDKQE